MIHMRNLCYNQSGSSRKCILTHIARAIDFMKTEKYAYLMFIYLHNFSQSRDYYLAFHRPSQKCGTVDRWRTKFFWGIGLMNSTRISLITSIVSTHLFALLKGD